MSKELVISAASHERRVAILEEGQLVEIYIEREKEFALVGSIYKGKVTRVLPGMQSAFVDIGLDGDAFLYVSDVFENLEDYAHGHGAEAHPTVIPPVAALAEALPGEVLAQAHPSDEEAQGRSDDILPEEVHQDHAPLEFAREPHTSHAQEHHGDAPSREMSETHGEPAEERQPESNASAPQNFSPQYNPTQKYTQDRGGDRSGGGRDFRGGSGDRSGSGDRGGDHGRGGRWGRRGGRRRGGRPQGGRNLPPSKYASPQGEQRPHDSRGYEQRGPQPRGFEPRDNRRAEGSRYGAPPTAPSAPSGSDEEPFVLPGESLAKYRGKPMAAAPPIEAETEEAQPEVRESMSRESMSRPAPVQPGGTATGGNMPRRSSGGLPRWLLAEPGNETSSTGTEEIAGAAEDTNSAIAETPAHAEEATEPEAVRPDASLSDEDVAVISSSLIEAKHEETEAQAAAGAMVGGPVFEEEEGEDEADESEEAAVEEREEIHASEEADLAHQEAHEDAEQLAADSHALREEEADAAHESALHSAELGEPAAGEM